MDMKVWLKVTTTKERELVAKAAKTKPSYFYQIAGGHRNPKLDLAERLVAATEKHTPSKKLTLAGLVPDIDSLIAEHAS